MFLHTPTSIEAKLLNELKRRNLDFKFQYRVFGGFVVDFAFPKFKLAVECDGDYWHANPKKYSGKKLNEIQKKNSSIDPKRAQLIQLAGWKILRFWESEIKQNVEAIADEIEKNLQN